MGVEIEERILRVSTTSHSCTVFLEAFSVKMSNRFLSVVSAVKSDTTSDVEIISPISLHTTSENQKKKTKAGKRKIEEKHEKKKSKKKLKDTQ